ncbi:MAG: pseudouridine synthase [Eubacteriales bacterium]|nr:pseudouridine synthase [Eubacteriales bacterium]
MEQRLQKLISAAGLMSRRAAEEYINSGRVTVNGAVARLGDKADSELDAIAVDGIPLRIESEKKYVMLNKPKGYVTTMKDEQGRKNVTELVSEIGTRLYPVGRLDMYSEGLLIMTNDGDFANLLMHPSHNFIKTYRTWVQGEDIGEAVEYLRQPILLDECEVCAVDVDIEQVFFRSAILLISISEGRNRQVRRMCESCGLKVTKLMRISEGPLTLGTLPEGKWRYLTDTELDSIRGAE